MQVDLTRATRATSRLLAWVFWCADSDAEFPLRLLTNLPDEYEGLVGLVQGAIWSWPYEVNTPADTVWELYTSWHREHRLPTPPLTPNQQRWVEDVCAYLGVERIL